MSALSGIQFFFFVIESQTAGQMISLNLFDLQMSETLIRNFIKDRLHEDGLDYEVDYLSTQEKLTPFGPNDKLLQEVSRSLRQVGK